MAAPKSKAFSIPGVAAGRVVAPVPTGDDIAPADRVKALFHGISGSGEAQYNGWAPSLLTQLQLQSASASPSGNSIFTLTVLDSHCNRLGNMHGGCTATLFDICTTSALAPIAKPGFWAYAGVSRTLAVTYIRPIPAGAEIVIDSTVVHAGKRLSTMTGVMRRKSDGAVLATCEHLKVSIDPEVSKM